VPDEGDIANHRRRIGLHAWISPDKLTSSLDPGSHPVPP
jgi:hypothetical protein